MHVKTDFILLRHNENSNIGNKENINAAESLGLDVSLVNPKIKRSFGTPFNLNTLEGKPLRELDSSIPVDSGDVTILSSSTNADSEPSVNRDSVNAEDKKKRRERTTYTKMQLTSLQEAFKQTKYPDVSTREVLSKKIGIPETRIQVWFKNRRAKGRKEVGRANTGDGESEYPFYTGKNPIYGVSDSSFTPQSVSNFNMNHINFDPSQNQNNIPVNLPVNPMFQ
ncbi:hypothetical protein MXB_3536, partial [Myxobolus squamalis]